MLPPGLLRPLLAVGGITTALLVAFGVSVRDQGTGTAPDRWLAARLHLGPHDPTGYAVGWVVGTLSDPVPAAVCVGALALACLLTRRRRLAVLVVLATFATDAVGIGLKHVFDRTIHGPENLSYPSTHAAQSTAFSMLAALWLTSLVGLRTRTRLVLVLGTGLVGALATGWALVAGSVHYATDTAAGAGLALFVVPATGWALDRLADRRRRA